MWKGRSFMGDDEKMFNIGVAMLMGVVFVIVFLQVCFRVQNNNLKAVRHDMENTQHDLDVAGTKLTGLLSADSLRSSVVETNKRAEVVSFSKTVHIDSIPMVQEQ